MEKSAQMNTAEVPPTRSGSPTPLAVCKEGSRTAKQDVSDKQRIVYEKRPRVNKRESVKGSLDEHSKEMVISKKRERPNERESELVDKKSRSYTFYTRMGPGMIRDFIESNPSEHKVQAIESMGFGGLLKIQMETIPVQLAFWLASNFDPSSSSIRLSGGQRLQITDYDIHLAMGIPNGQIQVQEATKKDTSEEFLNSKANWSKQFGSVKLTTKHILNKLIEDEEGGEQFKRNFVVFIVNSLLGGLKGANPSYRILKSLENLEAVKSMDWCAYTRKYLVEGVEKWIADKSEQPVFAGPIVVLVYIYLDRCMFRHTLVKRSIPTLVSWTKNAITSRLKRETETGFGKGGLQKQISKAPVVEAPCSAIVISKPSKEPFNEQSHSNTSFKKVAEAAIQLALAFENFFLALDEAKLDNPNSEVIQLMASLAEKLFQGLENSTKENQSEDDVDKSEGMREAFREFSNHKSFDSEDDLFRALKKLAKAVGFSLAVPNKRPVSPLHASSSLNEHVTNKTLLIEDKPVEVVPLFLTNIDFDNTISEEPNLHLQNEILEDDELLLKNATVEAEEMVNIQVNNPISEGKDYNDNEQHVAEDIMIELEQVKIPVNTPISEAQDCKDTEKDGDDDSVVGMAEDFQDKEKDVVDDAVLESVLQLDFNNPISEAQDFKDTKKDDGDDFVVGIEEVKIPDSEVEDFKDKEEDVVDDAVLESVLLLDFNNPTCDTRDGKEQQKHIVESIVSPQEKGVESIETTGNASSQTNLITPPSEKNIIIISDPPEIASRSTGKKAPKVTGKRKVVSSEVFRSPYIQRNISYLGHLSRSEKLLLDSALSESASDRYFNILLKYLTSYLLYLTSRIEVSNILLVVSNFTH